MTYDNTTKTLTPDQGCYLVRDFDGEIFTTSTILHKVYHGFNIIDLQPTDFTEYEYK